MAYGENLKKNKTKLFRFSEEEFNAMNIILERKGMSFQKYIEFKIKEELMEVMNNEASNERV